MKYKTTLVLGYKLFSDSLDKVNISKCNNFIINTINPHSYVCAKDDKLFRDALNESDILLPDGIGIVYASKWINNININRVTGYDLLAQMLNNLNKINGKCFFMGTNNDTLLKIKSRIELNFDNIEVGFHAPPYTYKFTYKENKQILDKVNEYQPDVLFVGLGGPKQEKWLHENKNNLKANVFCCVGAVFDFYSGAVKRPHKFWADRGLEWLIRFATSPLTFWRRNIVSMPIFIKDAVKAKYNY